MSLHMYAILVSCPLHRWSQKKLTLEERKAKIAQQKAERDGEEEEEEDD